MSLLLGCLVKNLIYVLLKSIPDLAEDYMRMAMCEFTVQDYDSVYSVEDQTKLMVDNNI